MAGAGRVDGEEGLEGASTRPLFEIGVSIRHRLLFGYWTAAGCEAVVSICESVVQ